MLPARARRFRAHQVRAREGPPPLPQAARFAWALVLCVALIAGAAGGAAAQAPLPAATYQVPTRIDATGKRDVSRQLGRFIRSVPNGSTIRFQPRGTYRLKRGGIVLSGRRNLVLDGQGARLKSFGCRPEHSPLRVVEGSSGIVIRDLVLAGSNRRGGTRRAHSGRCEHQPGIGIYRSFDTTIEDVDIRKTNGDCLYIAEGTRGGRTTWSDGVIFRDSTCRANGRMGVAVVGGRDILVERVVFDRVAMYVLDIEPNHRRGGGADIVFRENLVRRYTVDADWNPWLFAANGAAGDGIVRNVTVTRNRVTGGALRAKAWIRTRRDLTFTNNVSTVRARGPVMEFRHVRGLTIRGNEQPLRSGPLAHIRASSGVRYEP